MKGNFRRVCAWIGIILLAAMYLVTLLSAIFATEATGGLFMASLFLTFVVPVWIYVMQMVYKRVHSEDAITKKEIKSMMKETGNTKE